MIEVLRLLHELNGSETRYSRSYYVRHLEDNEPIPQFGEGEGHGIPETPLAQRNWIWVAYSSKDDSPQAILMAAPMHNVAMLLRVYAIKTSPMSIWLGLFRKVLADISKRGYTQYAVFLDKNNPICMKLYDVATHAGAGEIKGNHLFVAGPTNIGRL